MLVGLFLVVMTAGVALFARRRGVPAWPFVVVMIWGYEVVARVTKVGEGPNVLAGAAWCFLVYLSLFAIRGRDVQKRESWRCPDCQALRESSRSRCDCGHQRKRSV